VVNGGYYNLKKRIDSLLNKANAANTEEVKAWCVNVSRLLALLQKDPLADDFIGKCFKHLFEYEPKDIETSVNRYIDHVEELYKPLREEMDKFIDDYEAMVIRKGKSKLTFRLAVIRVGR